MDRYVFTRIFDMHRHLWTSYALRLLNILHGKRTLLLAPIPSASRSTIASAWQQSHSMKMPIVFRPTLATRPKTACSLMFTSLRKLSAPRIRSGIYQSLSGSTVAPTCSDRRISTMWSDSPFIQATVLSNLRRRTTREGDRSSM
jgi:hypothetical protein